MDDEGLFVNHESCHVCGCSKEQYYTLKHRVEESKQRITLMESEFLQNTLYTENELEDTRDELRLLQQKYNALEKSHQELHEVNQDLEERILDVDKNGGIQAASYEKEKQALNREVLTLSQKLLDTRFEINKLEEKNQRYKKDCELAVQLLQCTPSGAYQQHKVSTLPNELQYYVHQIMAENVATPQGGNNNTSNGNPAQTSPKATNPKQPLLNGGSVEPQPSSQYGMLASRIYDTVPANVVARAIQRRDDAEKREMDKRLQISSSRRRKAGGSSSSSVVMHDKGIQTLYPYLSDQKYDMLCVKCGVNMRDVTLEEEELAKVEKLVKVEDLVEVDPVDPLMDMAPPLMSKDARTTSAPLENLLDLSDTTPVQRPVEAKDSLLLDFLENPSIPVPAEVRAEPVQTPGQALAELLYGASSGDDDSKKTSEEEDTSNASSSQGSATPGDSGVYDGMASPVPTDQPASEESHQDQTRKEDEEKSSSRPESEVAVNGKTDTRKYDSEEDSERQGENNEPPPPIESKSPAKVQPRKPPANKVGPQPARKGTPRINGSANGQMSHRNRPLGNSKPKNPMDGNQVRPGKPEAKVSPVTKTVEPPAPTPSPKPSPKPARIEEPTPKATQVKSQQGQHYLQTSV